MTVKLKKGFGDGGSFLDSSCDNDLKDVLTALVEAHAQTVAQFNQLRTDLLAHPVVTTATALDTKIEKE